ncbi:MAG: histidine phosphatase family protein [Propionibacteriaceae bacterium]|jgi:phosphohistidine phosphatase|nr:histidine phosphatase family protein [Propionibacteriaceae bacterium]
MASRAKTLYLMRHAHAAASGALGDKFRPLDAIGREQARLVGAMLAGSGVEHILVSTAARTRQTVAELGLLAPVEADDALYDAGPSTLLERVRSLPTDKSVALVCGHNPTIASAVWGLADAATSDPQALADIAASFPTATCCQLVLGPTWEDLDRARLVRTLRPKRPQS